jgi:hypothetical protein
MEGLDLRLEISACAYLNAQLLSLVEQGGTLWDAKKFLFSQEPYAHSFSDADVYNYKPHDHSLAISLLYCSIVVPREILNLPADHPIYHDFDALQVTKSFVVIEPSMDSFRFIRCLRNSVAHALFRITDQNGSTWYEFWTEQSPYLKRASIDHRGLLDFIKAVGVPLVNAVLACRPADSYDAS